MPDITDTHPRHLHVVISQPTHEALALATSRARTSASSWVRELIERSLREQGLLADEPAAPPTT